MLIITNDHSDGANLQILMSIQVRKSLPVASYCNLQDSVKLGTMHFDINQDLKEQSSLNAVWCGSTAGCFHRHI